MTAQLALFDTPAPPPPAPKRRKHPPAPPAALPGLFPPATPRTSWPLTLTVKRDQNYALLAADKSPTTAALLERAARSAGLPVRAGAVLIAPVGYTPLGDIGGEFLQYLARQYPDRELQVWRTTVTETDPPAAPTAPTDPAPTPAPSPEPPSKLAALAQANPGRILVVRPAPVAPPVTPGVPVYVAPRDTWPVNLTVYAAGQTVITTPAWGVEVFRQMATRHHYAPDGDAVVTVAQRVDAAQPWTAANVRLDDQAQAFIDALPQTGVHWHFQFVDHPLPEQYTPARLAEPDADGTWDHIYTIDFEDTRADQLTAGDLVDITDTAREAGFKLPVAVTRALWDSIEDIPPAHSYQSVRGRLWDLVSLAYLAARQNPDANVVHFKLIMHHQNYTYLNVTMTIGPGDDAESVITLMLPDEE